MPRFVSKRACTDNSWDPSHGVENLQGLSNPVIPSALRPSRCHSSENSLQRPLFVFAMKIDSAALSCRRGGFETRPYHCRGTQPSFSCPYVAWQCHGVSRAGGDPRNTETSATLLYQRCFPRGRGSTGKGPYVGGVHGVFPARAGIHGRSTSGATSSTCVSRAGGDPHT